MTLFISFVSLLIRRIKKQNTKDQVILKHKTAIGSIFENRDQYMDRSPHDI